MYFCLITAILVGPQDYEYASYNHIAFDIANYFWEVAADYQVVDVLKSLFFLSLLHFEIEFVFFPRFSRAWKIPTHLSGFFRFVILSNFIKLTDGSCLC